MRRTGDSAERGGYWEKRSRSISRRTFVRGTGLTALGLSGAALIGCGSDEDAPATAAATATSASTADVTATAAETGIKSGGTYRTRITGDPATLDPYGSASFTTKGFASYVYSRLFKIDAQPNTNPYNQGLVGDLAESAESEDGQHWTVKLRPGVKFHDIAPVSGREVTAEDVVYSWERLKAPESVNAVNVEDIVSLEAVDDQTLAFITAAPTAIFLEKLADANNLWVLPVESDSGYQVTTTAIGSGPWMLDNYQVSSRLDFIKNPNYWDSEVPYLDGVTENIIPEYANGRAQFEAGNLDVLAVTADDVLDMYSRGEGWQWVGAVNGGVHYAFFSSMEQDPDAPWQDERFRNAMSMALNRSDLMELVYNIKALEDAGLEPSSAWNNIVALTLGKWWLDPQSAAQGTTAANFEFNQAEAQKLLAAVGAEGAPIKWQYAGARYGAAFDRVAEACAQMFADIGLKVETEIQDYNATYFPQTRAGNFHGLAMGTTPAYPEVSGFVDRFFSTGSSNATKVDDATINDLRTKQVTALDTDQRVEYIHEIQRINAEKMYYMPLPTGAGTSFTAYQGPVRGIRKTRGYGVPTEETAYYWLDV
jgi:peptide/nickel transport system substrate-binding protein